MAEAQEAVVVVPVTLPVAEVELEVASRVPVHVRYLVVVAAEPKCNVHHTVRISTESSTGHLLNFMPSLCSNMYAR